MDYGKLDISDDDSAIRDWLKTQPNADTISLKFMSAEDGESTCPICGLPFSATIANPVVLLDDRELGPVCETCWTNALKFIERR